MRLLVVVAAAALAQWAPYAQAAEPVGRVFFTPEQRTQLDNLRRQKVVASQTRDEPAPETVTYRGIVRRSDGKAIVWINNEALSETDLRNKQSIVGSIGRDGRITLQASQAEVQLKVGQSATLFSGKIEESFATPKKPDNSADSKSPAAAKPETKAAPAAAGDIPPELLEALRQAAARNGSAAPVKEQNPPKQ